MASFSHSDILNMKPLTDCLKNLVLLWLFLLGAIALNLVETASRLSQIFGESPGRERRLSLRGHTAGPYGSGHRPLYSVCRGSNCFTFCLIHHFSLSPLHSGASYTTVSSLCIVLAPPSFSFLLNLTVTSAELQQSATADKADFSPTVDIRRCWLSSRGGIKAAVPRRRLKQRCGGPPLTEGDAAERNPKF